MCVRAVLSLHAVLPLGVVGWGGWVGGGVQFVELDKRDDGNAIRYELSQMTGRTSVPQIWIGGEFVGGCDDGACLCACFLVSPLL